MNPNEIKKALKEHISQLSQNKRVVLCGTKELLEIFKSTLAYINQLESDFQLLKNDYENLKGCYEDAINHNRQLRVKRMNDCAKIKTAKSDEIKEFAERLKEKVRMNCFCEKFVFESDIDNLVKEMAGDV